MRSPHPAARAIGDGSTLPRAKPAVSYCACPQIQRTDRGNSNTPLCPASPERQGPMRRMHRRAPPRAKARKSVHRRKGADPAGPRPDHPPNDCLRRLVPAETGLGISPRKPSALQNEERATRQPLRSCVALPRPSWRVRPSRTRCSRELLSQRADRCIRCVAVSFEMRGRSG